MNDYYFRQFEHRRPADPVPYSAAREMLWQYLAVINLAKDFSPIDSLSTGRSVTWSELGKAFGQIVLFLSGIIALFGIVVFTRRELATAQGP